VPPRVVVHALSAAPQDELHTTRAGYEQQLAALSDHSVAVSAEADAARKRADELLACKVRPAPHYRIHANRA
jgi:hypothetical protein